MIHVGSRSKSDNHLSAVILHPIILIDVIGLSSFVGSDAGLCGSRHLSCSCGAFFIDIAGLGGLQQRSGMYFTWTTPDEPTPAWSKSNK